MAVLGDSAAPAGTWALGAVCAFVISAAGAGALALRLYQTVQLAWLDALIGLVFAIIAHYAMHAIGLRLVGGRPRAVWRFRALVPHLHVGSAGRLRRNGVVIAMVVPLMVVDAAGLALILLPATSGIGFAVVVANTVGSVPDLWRAARLAQLPRSIECELRGPTMLIWTPADHDRVARRVRSGHGAPPPPLVGVLGTWALCLLAAEAIIAGGVRMAAQWRGDLSVGGVLLASTQQFISGPDVILNLWPVVAAGAAVGTLAAAVWLTVVQIAPREGRRTQPARVVLRQP